MRPITLLILVALVGGGAYVFFFKPEWIGLAEKKAKEAIQRIEGYAPAKSPREAMEQFHKAVQKRRYDAAAIYCSGDYAAKLKKASGSAVIDKLNNQIAEKGFPSPKITQVLLMLDPYPNIFKTGEVKEAKEKEVAYGMFVPDMTEPLPPIPNNELTGMDPKVFVELGNGGFGHALVIPLGVKLEIRNDSEGEETNWKINYAVPQIQQEGIEYLISHYQSYVEGLNTFRDELGRGRMLKDQVFPELVKVLARSK